MSNNTNSYIVLTEQGLSAVATQPWPQIAIKYFLPMYDERIDTLIHTDNGLTSAMPLTEAITSADSQASLVGERIYNIPSTSGTYQLTNKYAATSAAGSTFATPETLFSTTVNKTCSRTTFNGYALSPIVSGNVEPVFDLVLDELQYVGGEANPLPVYAWPLNGANIKRENLFDSVSFNPTQTTNGSYNVISGLFKFTLRNVVGDYRFNKIAFFIQPMNPDGTVNDYYDPILFGQTIFDISQIVQVGGTGSQSFEITVQLAFTIKDSMVVVTNNDYWSMIPTSASTRNQNGLFFAGDVALGTSSVPNSWQPRAKMHITDDTNAAQLRLSHSTGLSGIDVTLIDTGTSGMVSFIPTSGYSQGFGYTFGSGNYAVGAGLNKVAFALGTSSIAIGSNAFAFGNKNNVINTKSNACAAIGSLNYVSESSFFGYGSYALGTSNSAIDGAFAFGLLNSAFNAGSIAIGYENIATHPNPASTSFTLALGGTNKVYSEFSMGIGNGNKIYAAYAIAHGWLNNVNGNGPFNGIFGYNNTLNTNGQSKNWIFGSDNTVTSAANSLTVGNGNNVAIAGGSPIIFGHNNTGDFGGILIGTHNEGPGNVFGSWSYAYYSSYAIGTSARAASTNSVAIGYAAYAGYNVANSPLPFANATASHNVAIGFAANTIDEASFSVAIGSFAQVNSISGYGTSVGDTARSSFKGTAIGAWSMAYGFESVALGYFARAYGTDIYQTDDSAGNNKGGIAIGGNALAWNGNYGIAIGYHSEAKTFSSRYAASFGYNVKTIPSESISNTYTMTSVGALFTNEYAGFMCGLNPANLTQVKVILGNNPAAWTFTPAFAVGGGDNMANNALMAGQLTTSAGTKSVIILDTATMIDTGNTPQADMGGVLSGLGAPKGTIFKGWTGYGVSPLFIWNGF